MIDITGKDLKVLIKKAYDLSVPKGMGFLHFAAGGISDDLVNHIIENGKKDPDCAVEMDYVGGRCCKFDVSKEGNKLLIPDKWFDHTDEEYKELLSAIGVEAPRPDKHAISCECSECNKKRKK